MVVHLPVIWRKRERDGCSLEFCGCFSEGFPLPLVPCAATSF